MNQFQRLHRWASGQDENFTTECLLIVLQMLLDKAPPLGLALVKAMVGFDPGISPNDAQYLKTRTQSSYAEGRTDFELVLRDDLYLIVEVKVESPLGPRQLSNYRGVLSGVSARDKRLVLLTKYPPPMPDLVEFADHYTRWFQIGECLRELMKSGAIEHMATGHMVEQFVEFLKERGMTAETVGWELSRGIRAWQALHGMIYQALGNSGKVPRSSVEAEWGGWYSNNQTQVWFGITWKNPAVLECETKGLRVESVPDGFGTKITDSRHPGGQKWVAFLDLESEEVHFHSRSLPSQKEVVETFVKRCLEVTANLPTR